MALGYSDDLRVRVIEGVESGESRRAAARRLRVAASSAIRWMQRFDKTGSFSALRGKRKPRSPLAAHSQWLLDVVKTEPDATLDEIAARLFAVHGLQSSASAVCRFYLRAGISFKKNRARQRTGTS
jgi:transposase